MKKVLSIAIIFQLVVIGSLSAAKKLDILIFFVDDLGWPDLGYQNPKVETPNIDRLNTEGLAVITTGRFGRHTNLPEPY